MLHCTILIMFYRIIQWKPSESDSLHTKFLSIPNTAIAPKPTNSYIYNPFKWKSPLNRIYCLVPRGFGLEGFHGTELTSRCLLYDNWSIWFVTAELNSQLQDLQEAHETTVADLHTSESKVKELSRENDVVRNAQSDRVRQTEDENRFLKTEVGSQSLQFS